MNVRDEYPRSSDRSDAPGGRNVDTEAPASSLDLCIGQNLRRIAEAAGWSSTRLATALQISESTLLEIEAGRLRADGLLLVDAGCVLGVPPSVFFTGVRDH